MLNIKFNFNFNVMECTKSNEASMLGGKKKKQPHLLEVLGADANWGYLSKKDRKSCMLFALSFSSVILLSHTWLVIPAIISLILSSANVMQVNVRE